MRLIHSLLFALLTLLVCCCSAPSEGVSDTEEVTTETAADTAQWQTVATTGEPTARHENAFTELDGKFYLIGGRGNKPVDIYDPATQSWSTGAQPPLEMHHFQAVPHQGKIYVMGAFTGGYPDETPIPHVYSYDPASDQWERGAEIPEARRRGAAGVVVHDNHFYIVCGIRNGHLGDYKDWLDEYDLATNTWTALPNAPHTRDHFQAVVADGKIYAAGGRNSSAATEQTFELTVPEVDVYDVASQEWQTLSASLPTERAGSTTVLVDNNIVVIGGESDAMEAAHHQVEALNIATGTWEEWPRLEQGRHGTQAAMYDGTIHIAAGSGNRGGGPELTSLEKYQPLSQ